MTEYIRVVAPATLAENYSFDVLVDGKPFTVVVPQGGVREGEEFEVPYATNDGDSIGSEEDQNKNDEDLPLQPTISSSSSGEDDQSTDDSDRLGAPYGRFRVSLCSCCDVLTQATFWMALCCYPILLAQLLTRLRLRWNGKEFPRANDNYDQSTQEQEEHMATFVKIVLSFVVALVLGYIPVLGSLVLLLFYLATVVWIGGNIRYHVRQRYRIPTRLPKTTARCEMCFCCCCSIIQIARHTHNDKDWPGYCCSATGLEAGAPKVLPVFSSPENVPKQ